MPDPVVSVIMAVYKEKPDYVSMAIESILCQTLQEFEFIIVYDDPDGMHEALLLKYSRIDSRIRFIRNSKNIGLASSLNRAISESKGHYIARMDADDVSAAVRFESQLNFIIESGVDIIGCNIERINEFNQVTGRSSLPSSEHRLHCLLPFATIAFHPTWFGKSSVFKALLYNEVFLTSQDYEFLNRAISKGYRVSNIQKTLLKYREVANSLSLSRSVIQIKLHLLVRDYHKGKVDDLSVEAAKVVNEEDKDETIAYGRAFTCFLSFIRTRKFSFLFGIVIGFVRSRLFRKKLLNYTLAKLILRF